MPKIIKSGVNYIPDIPDIPQADGITIIDSEGVFSAVQQNVPQPDWFTSEGLDGFIDNKPYISWDGDDNVKGTVIGSINSNNAHGEYSLAEGIDTKAIGNHSHAEGRLTTASGDNSHAEGDQTQATAISSHAEGLGTITPNIMGAHVQGRFNSNIHNETLIDIVGYGTNNSNRQNIYALNTNGRGIFRDSITIGADKNSQGGYMIPIPVGLDYGKYVLSFEKNSDTGQEQVTWEPFELNEDPNRYQYKNATSTNQGPFTIYDGTDTPSSSLGKAGDIYFKHS